jgi:hypothetical protein
MICPRCGTENRASAAFCTACSYGLAPGQAIDESADPRHQPAPAALEEQLEENTLPRPRPELSADPAGPPPPGPARPGRSQPAVLIAWGVAVAAIIAAALMTASRAGLSTEAADLRDQVEDQQQVVRARQTDIEALRKANADMEGKLEECQRMARTSRDAYDLWIDLASSFDNPEQAGRAFTKLINISEKWDRAIERCLAQ